MVGSRQSGSRRLRHSGASPTRWSCRPVWRITIASGRGRLVRCSLMRCSRVVVLGGRIVCGCSSSGFQMCFRTVVYVWEHMKAARQAWNLAMCSHTQCDSSTIRSHRHLRAAVACTHRCRHRVRLGSARYSRNPSCRLFVPTTLVGSQCPLVLEL